jgi:hypothetical protein
MQDLRNSTVLMGTVLRLMLARTLDDEGTHDDSTAPRCAPLPFGPANGGPAGSVVELLHVAPHTIPYALRVNLFRDLLAFDKASGGWMGPQAGRPRSVEVHRGHVLEGAYQKLLPLGSQIKGPLAVTYIDAHGMPEPGVALGICCARWPEHKPVW